MFARLILAAAALGLAAGAHAQTPHGQRLAGTVKSVDAQHLVLATGSGDVDLRLTPKTRVMAQARASAADIKPGTYLGTANVTDAAGQGRATEVHVMPSGPNVHSVMNADQHLMMTNGHVTAVAKTAKGEAFDVDYGAGKPQHVVLPAGVPVTRLAQADLGAVKAGAKVDALAVPGADGKLTAAFIAVRGAK
jgi:hypothetical protein